MADTDPWSHTARVLGDDDLDLVEQLRSDPAVAVIDRSSRLRQELGRLHPTPADDELTEPLRWVHYPWRNALVRMLGPRGFRRLRLDRNRLKIKQSEQERLGRLRIGVVGLSTGHPIALALAAEGLCAHLRLAEFDSLDLSNLNRVPGSLLDIGENKAIIAARRLAELDPYLDVAVYPDGLTEKNVDEFAQGLDLIVEQCDSFDMKITVRLVARSRRIPVLMETNDRGLLDVERFDLEPDRPLFHGLLGDADPAALRHLSVADKAPYLLGILGADQISPGAGAALFEVGHTVSNWPQLAGETFLGAACVAAAVRRFGLGHTLPSGRQRVDLDDALDRLTEPVPGDARALSIGAVDVVDLTTHVPTDPIEATIHAARLAPSGGNSQPWTIQSGDATVRITLARARTSTMDLDFRASLVAIGAAAFNARVAAARHGLLGPTRLVVDEPDPAVELTLAPGTDPALARQYPAMIRRMSNRGEGVREPLGPALRSELARAAADEGGRLWLIEDERGLRELADVLAESDRIRYLTPHLHREMFAELSWPGRDRLDVGIDVRTLGLAPKDMSAVMLLRRADVLDRLTPEPDLGTALGDMTRDRVRSASALAVVTVSGTSPLDYVRGGGAVERVWVTASAAGLGVYPVSPVFLFATSGDQFDRLAPQHATRLGQLQRRMGAIIGLGTNDRPALLLRLSHQPGPAIRSGRLPLSEIVVSSGKPDHRG